VFVSALQSYHPKIRVEQDDLITTVTLDAPDAKNACTGGMWVALGRIFTDLSYSGTRVIVLTGESGDFCAGADLSGGGEEPGPNKSMVDAMRVLADVVRAVHDCPVPVISKVDGVCVGAGLGLCLATDLTWCSDRARFSAIFAKRGLSLDFGTSWLLRERVGAHRAKEIAFTAKMLSATEADQLGLVNAVVPVHELDSAVTELATTIANGPPGALSMMKRQIDNASGISLAQALETEALAQGVNVKTHDMREALTAWAERRPPKFEGR
jgi:2-(1,2-epoxy-1,2-dihydrophenyl)acetyl-CoA isomerase